MAVNEAVNYDSLVQEDRVHSRVYTDPQIFEDEMERIFHRGWVFVGHASEIPKPGDYRMAWVGRYPIIMVRGEDGEVTTGYVAVDQVAVFWCDADQWLCEVGGLTYRVVTPSRRKTSVEVLEAIGVTVR